MQQLTATLWGSSPFPFRFRSMRMKKSDPKGSRAYIKKRDARITELFVREGLEPREIAIRMSEEETLRSDSSDSATRTVRGVVAKIRKTINANRVGDSAPAFASNESDALERKLVWLRTQRDRQQLIADGEPIEMCARSSYPLTSCPNTDCRQTGWGHLPFTGPAVGIVFMQTPQGPMTTFRALWPAGVRQKASKDAATLASQIAELELLLIGRRDAHAESGENGDGERLHLIESDKSIEELIEANLIVGSFGKKNNGGTSGGTAARA